VNRGSGHNHLESIELGRVVGTSDLNPTVYPELVESEIQARRREHTDIDRRPSCRRYSLRDAGRQRLAGRAIITPHSRHIGGQVFAHDTSDVVLPKDHGRDMHG
jgi:hypothetical protein